MNTKNFVVNTIALCIISILSVSQLTYGAEPDGRIKETSVNGVNIKNEIYVNDKGEYMYPIREVSDAIGTEVKWNPEDNSCEVYDGDRTFLFAIGNNEYSDGNETQKELESVPELKDNISYVPSSFLKEFLSLDISGEDSGAIKITSKPEVILDKNNVAIINRGEIFAVSLEQNTSTGYSWTAEKSDNIELLNTIEENENNQAESGILGRPSTVTWIYKCDVPGEYNIKYTYSRSFEDNSTADTAEFKFIVAE